MFLAATRNLTFPAQQSSRAVRYLDHDGSSNLPWSRVQPRVGVCVSVCMSLLMSVFVSVLVSMLVLVVLVLVVLAVSRTLRIA